MVLALCHIVVPHTQETALKVFVLTNAVRVTCNPTMQGSLPLLRQSTSNRTSPIADVPEIIQGAHAGSRGNTNTVGWVHIWLGTVLRTPALCSTRNSHSTRAQARRGIGGPDYPAPQKSKKQPDPEPQYEEFDQGDSHPHVDQSPAGKACVNGGTNDSGMSHTCVQPDM